MTIEAQIIPSKPPNPKDKALTILMTLSGEDEARFRSMMNVINDYGEGFQHGNEPGLSKALDHVFRIAADAVELIHQHKKRLY